MTAQMDEKDRKILNRIQTNFPMTHRPYRDIGQSLGMTEGEVLARVRKLREAQIIRRIGGSFDSKRLGFSSTLCAAKVPEDRLEAFNQVINAFPGVTHNYTRNCEYNIWFTFIGEDQGKIDQALEEITRKTGVADLLSLPALRTFKIKVNFEI